MKANYHTHTWRCHHASGDERAYVERAIEGGIEILGFSDHTPYAFPEGYYSTFRMEPELLEGYVDTVLALKKEYASDIEIHLGLEVEYYPEYFDGLLEMLRPYPIEYMLLAQHFIGNEIDEPYSGNHTYSKKILKRYCDQVIEAMNTGRFTYLAHPDLIFFRGRKSVYQEEMRRICKEAKRLGLPLEINFLGLMDGRNYPTGKFWEIAGQENCDVIFGCDAHQPEAAWNPEAEKRAQKKYVEKYGLHLLETCKLKGIFE